MKRKMGFILEEALCSQNVGGGGAAGYYCRGGRRACAMFSFSSYFSCTNLLTAFPSVFRGLYEARRVKLGNHGGVFDR